MPYRFSAEVIEWRGPSPFFFAPIPDDLTPSLAADAREASYGWGVVPVTVELAGHGFTTSLFPRGGAYLVPLKASVRQATGVVLGDEVELVVTVEPRR